MSDLLARLRAMRGGSTVASEPQTGRRDLASSAARLEARLVEDAEGVHFVRDLLLPPGSLHGSAPLGQPSLHPLLWRQAGGRAAAHGATGSRDGPVLYIDTETTGLAGGAGTFAFLIGVGRHAGEGFAVRQLFLPGPEFERSQLLAFAELVAGAAAVVTYNGASFDLPLLRNRFALHRLPDPLLLVPHLDLLTVARRLWRDTLPDCSLSTVERHILGAPRGPGDVPGAEVPARYLAFLRHQDTEGLRGVVSHNQTDIVALAALRSRVERLIDEPSPERPHEVHALGSWLERLGEDELALARYLEAANAGTDAAWQASLLLKRLGRLPAAADIWLELGRQGMASAWVELAKLQEHRQKDYLAALASVSAASECSDGQVDLLEQRRERLMRKLHRRPT